jgi:internalin A
MSKNTLVQQLIEENLRTQNPYLDLGNCGLDGTEPELEMLAECEHLETLILSNGWCEYDEEKQEWIQHTNQNQGRYNNLKSIATQLPKNLKKLVLAGDWDNKWEIQDISFLQHLNQLQTLDLSGNKIQDISFLQHLNQLQWLDLSGNKIQDYSFLQHLSQLLSLDLSGNKIQGISFLQHLSQLQWLDLRGNQIQDISCLQHLNQLQSLDLSWNQIQDYSCLQQLNQLRRLSLCRNQTQDYAFLQHLSTLQSLNLSHNQIQDISFLQHLSQLLSLDLSYNQIQDFNPLKQLSQLRNLRTSGNPFKFPPIWLVYFESKGGFLGDYVHLEELPFANKIWQLMDSNDEINHLLASQLALSQGWSEEAINMYLHFKQS